MGGAAKRAEYLKKVLESEIAEKRQALADVTFDGSPVEYQQLQELLRHFRIQTKVP